jgi:hypothetical protein
MGWMGSIPVPTCPVAVQNLTLAHMGSHGASLRPFIPPKAVRAGGFTATYPLPALVRGLPTHTSNLRMYLSSTSLPFLAVQNNHVHCSSGMLKRPLPPKLHLQRGPHVFSGQGASPVPAVGLPLLLCKEPVWEWRARPSPTPAQAFPRVHARIHYLSSRVIRYLASVLAR